MNERPTTERMRIDGELYVVERWELQASTWTALCVRYEDRYADEAEIVMITDKGRKR